MSIKAIKRKLSKRVTYSLGFAGSQLLVRQISRMSLSSMCRLAQVGSRLTWNFGLRERSRVLTHLRMAFPERPTSWIVRTGRRVFESQAMAQAATVHVAFADPAGLGQVLDGSELVEWIAGRPQGRGSLMLTPHIGPFILQATIVGRAAGLGLEVVVRPARVEYVAELEEQMFSRLSINTRPQGAGLRDMVKSLRKGMIIGMAPDHDVRKISGAFVPFFGMAAYTPTGPAVMARLADAELCVAVPVPTGKTSGPQYVTRVEAVPMQRTDDSIADVTENTRRWMAVVERYVLAYPAEWSWMNRRWRTRPEERPRTEVWDPAVHQRTVWDAPEVRPA